MNLGWAKILDRTLGRALGQAIGRWDALRETLVSRRARMSRVEHLLVVKYWGLGNWALLRPVVLDLRAHYAHARLTIATLDANRDLVDDLADDLLLVRTSSLPEAAGDIGRAVAWLRRRPPDLSVDFEQFVHTGALVARLGLGARRVGFASGDPGRDGLYTVLAPFHADRHASRSFRDLAEAAGVPPGPYVPGALEVSPAGRIEVGTLGVEAPYVVLHPGSGDNFPGRRWSRAGFIAVARTAIAHDHRVVVTGGASEVDLARGVACAGGPHATSVAGRLSIRGLVALLAGARAVVSNDTGPVHLASALGVPVLAIYGPNTPVLYGPLAPGSQAFYRDLPCSPCLTPSNYRSSRCRIHTCTASIPTGEVTGALVRLLVGTCASFSPPSPCERSVR